MGLDARKKHIRFQEYLIIKAISCLSLMYCLEDVWKNGLPPEADRELADLAKAINTLKKFKRVYPTK